MVIATHNRKKAGEMIQILSQEVPHLQLLTLADFPGAPEPEETGSTYQANATIKAESAQAFTSECSLADDAGLEIDYLNGEPGVWSKRFAGEETPFTEKMAKILALMKDTKGKERAARFRCCIALTHGRDQTTTFEAICEGLIAEHPSGSGGFGYDPIFYLPDLGCTMADLSAVEKHRISHRGKVLSQLVQYLKSNACPDC